MLLSVPARLQQIRYWLTLEEIKAILDKGTLVGEGVAAYRGVFVKSRRVGRSLYIEWIHGSRDE